ncbi:MAG: CAP domain-containing protein [Firmicutes bacterium]|nr:CAP domain-containing protein [Bacillota bacterium]
MPAAVLGTSRQQDGLFAEVNTYRQKNGRAVLKRDADLERRAQEFAQDMANRDYFSHTSPDGATFSVRIAGYEGAAAENIAAGQTSAVAVVQAWSTSQGHNANMLNLNYRAMGVGYAYNAQSTYKHYWVLILGSKDVAGQSYKPTHDQLAKSQPAEISKSVQPQSKQSKITQTVKQPAPIKPTPATPGRKAPEPVETKPCNPKKPGSNVIEQQTSRMQEAPRTHQGNPNLVEPVKTIQPPDPASEDMHRRVLQQIRELIALLSRCLSPLRFAAW